MYVRVLVDLLRQEGPDVNLQLSKCVILGELFGAWGKGADSGIVDGDSFLQGSGVVFVLLEFGFVDSASVFGV